MIKLFSSTSCKDAEYSTNTPGTIQTLSTTIAAAKFSLCLAKEWLDAKKPQSSLWGCAGHTPIPRLPPGENNVALSAPGVVSTSKGQCPFLSYLQGICGWKKECIHPVRPRNIYVRIRLCPQFYIRSPGNRSEQQSQSKYFSLLLSLYFS